MKFPQARKENLLTTELEEEVVVYDPETKHAHSLNRTALAVWNHCDGQTSLADLQQRVSADVGAPITDAAIWLALRKLERAHLLAERIGSSEPMTRRQMLGKAGRLGAAAVAAPVVVSALVPVAAAAATPCSPAVVCGAGGTCACFNTVGNVGLTCLTSGVDTVHSPACVSGVTNCATLTGNAGSVCAKDTSSGLFFCTCTANANCPGGFCASNTSDFCHTTCAAPSCTC